MTIGIEAAAAMVASRGPLEEYASESRGRTHATSLSMQYEDPSAPYDVAAGSGARQRRSSSATPAYATRRQPFPSAGS